MRKFFKKFIPDIPVFRFLQEPVSAPKLSIQQVEREQPIRSEIYSAYQMANHGTYLAQTHVLVNQAASDPLLARLDDNERVIVETCALLTQALKDKRQITPASEWLLDNLPLIEDQISIARKHLPKGYSKGLPRLQVSDSDSTPRVYALALEIISHSDARVERESLNVFINAYQNIVPLQLGELWAIPIMLRLALIENLRRVAAQISIGRLDLNLANSWADKIIQTAEESPNDLILVIADMARSNPPRSASFTAEMARRIQGQGPDLAMPLAWMEQRLEQVGMTTEQLVYTEVQQQAVEQVSVSNSVGSLRFLNDMNWQKFVEAASVVEKTLLQDPAGTYARMDFITRDRYRHKVEHIAKQAGCSEEDIAKKVVSLARLHEGDFRLGHVGYYLIDKGRTELEQGLTLKLKGYERFMRWVRRYPLTIYLGSIFLITANIAFTLLNHARHNGMDGGFIVLLGIFCVFAASHFAVAMINWFATITARPDPLARLDFSEGIPDYARSLVSVPTMLTSISSIDRLCELLEVRFLANKERNLYFCLLTDFADAKTQTMPEDDFLLSRARGHIEELNKKYSPQDNDIFYLFHRPRVWNPAQGQWIGEERKRGKLSDLNEFLLEGETSPFSCIVGNTSALKNIRYVITLDSDTQLPRNAASQFAAAMAHPLNQPIYDERKQRVVAGYGILQPRVAASLPGDNSSLYADLCGGEPGIDPYTRAVSDVYQDAFGEGSFIGKGIYDVSMFERVLKGRFEDNRILSHDLLEGCFVRAGLLSDVQLYEAYPFKYSDDVSRRHRWIRGDWQIAGWIFGRVKRPGQGWGANPLSVLSRWKILDNLRRSLVPVSFLGIILYALLAAHSPVFWFWQIAFLLLVPSLYACLFDLTHKSKDISLNQHLMETAYAAGRHFANTGFSFLVLPYEAYYNVDAIIRTLWRMSVTKKNLLEWTPSSEATYKVGTDLRSVFKRMWVAPAFSAVVLILMIWHQTSTIFFAVPILALWFLSPLVVWKISLPLRRKELPLTPDQTAYLGKLARKTWAFFERFVGAEDHWLPPDNVQEAPVAVVAHRTSPTNMGLSLLANLSAVDFGYITLTEFIERTEKTLDTMERLERYRGHFYNWYDTQSLVPLNPLYVSAVDSGNLAGHLMVLRTGLLEAIDKPIVHERMFAGLQDTYNIILDDKGAQGRSELHSFGNLLKEASAYVDPTLTHLKNSLEKLSASAGQIERATGDLNSDTAWWAKILSAQCQKFYQHISWFEQAGVEKSAYTLRDFAKGDGNSISDRQSVRRAHDLIHRLEVLAEKAGQMSEMDYDFLFDKDKRLLSIGYHAADKRIDPGYYDLLASEARLGCFVAIAQGRIPQESWFALGRQLRAGGRNPILVSWSGSMFEYLMPLLVMPTYDKTLLDQTYKATVQRQIDYGTQRNVPWGISESGYYAFDTNLNYQYRAFGVPGLGMKRDLAEDLVIAPYASAMALMVAPKESCENLQKISSQGFEGRYGLYEAIDYTPSRLPRGKTQAVVQSFMVHHQGMSLLSFAYHLLNQPMQQRFSSEPMFQSALLLLHEKIPRSVAIYTNTAKYEPIPINQAHMPGSSVRVFGTAMTSIPEVNLLSNGRYNVMVTNAGGGYSRWNNLSISRWREDSTRDNWGSFCYIRDASSGDFWSTTYQPTLKVPDLYEVIFSEGRAEFRRRDHLIETHTEIVVSPEDDIEMRRSKITNRSSWRRTIEITSYAEVVLAQSASDAAHPAFSNLFVQTEILHKRKAILCTRRPRSVGEAPPWMFHLMSVHGAMVDHISYETDRMKFTGRGRSIAVPQAVMDTAPLSDSEGSVLDPIVAIRYRITLEPEQTAIVDIVTGAAAKREDCDVMIDKYQDSHLAARVLELAWTHSQVILRQLNATEADAQLYARIANAVIFPNASLRADAKVIIKNRRGQSGLWSYAISGDLPIVLLQIKDIENIDLVRQMVQAHGYWRMKGLAVDLVIWNEDNAGYRQVLQDQIYGMIAAGVDAHVIDRPGGIFVRPGDQISPEDRILLESVASVIISDERGTLEEQISRPPIKTARMPRLVPPSYSTVFSGQPKLPIPQDLVLYNGIGGFSPDGREYIIVTYPGKNTPAPWSNVLANPKFGTVISERGQSYTWSENAHEYRLTPWHNDPVSDQSGEAFYLRDETSGIFWSPLPGPCASTTPYVTRHGFGYSVFEHIEQGIQSELTVYVDTKEAVKYFVLKIKNVSGQSRRLSATGYVEWVLGELRPKSKMHVVTEIEPVTGGLLARNAYNTEFSNRVAFFDVDDIKKTITGDRREFVGRNGTMENPSSMGRLSLSGKVGAALDPCAGIQVPFELADGQSRQIIFRLGMGGHSVEEAAATLRRIRGPEVARAALAAVHSQWKEILGAVQIDTPDPSLNILANGWLMYQTIACRMWARSGYYQSGGAYGFRDQLQDAMALIHTKPELLRSQLLLHAAHQFVEGDVQHWWHPPSDRGVRTKCSDDYLWLPLATCRYVTATTDTGILSEQVHFIEGRKLNAEEDSYYDLPVISGLSASLYEHCVRALTHGLRFGERGLPLIGSCDWNDGMDKVGEHGKGESVWLGFFLYDILLQFAPVARQQGDENFAVVCEREAEKLKENIERHAWDGGWYRRAYFDDGTPLGSAQSEECQIDSLSQSWSVLSGAGDPERAAMAMNAVDQRLVRRGHGLIQLLDPPFDRSSLNPGYIRGYVPGVRENGGQYTHAAIWTAMAFAKMGDKEKAFELLQMINPLNHSRTYEEAQKYKVEPYVVTADVYGVVPHVGRGGWSWYTGSSGWLYRLILESIVGLKLEGNKLIFTPSIPQAWAGCTIQYRYKSSDYIIRLSRVAQDSEVMLEVELQDDGQRHEIEVKFKG